jgi:hypothetical protein
MFGNYHEASCSCGQKCHRLAQCTCTLAATSVTHVQELPPNVLCTRFNLRVSNILYAFRGKQRSVSYRRDVTANQNIHNMRYPFHARISTVNSFASVRRALWKSCGVLGTITFVTWTLVLHACPLSAVITNDKQNGPFQTTA